MRYNNVITPCAVIRSVAIFLFSFLIFHSASAQVEGYVSDTAWIDPQVEIPNQAESVVQNGHKFEGPGPFTVHFRAEMTEQPAYCAWEIAEDSTFQNVERFRPLEADGVTSLLDHEFSGEGSYYIRFTADFISPSGDTLTYNTKVPYEATISTSLLEIPNLITPDSGKNNVFLVKYQSLVSFEIWVYNRWGQQLFHTKDPAEGWDGKYNGSTVPTGVYYYLCKAEGTDGKKYVKKGDLNVLKTRSHQ